MSLETARLLEKLAIHAWPALSVEDLGGWRLRYGAGVTRRANAVWPNELSGAADLDTRITQVEKFYGERGLPPSFQLSPAALPGELDEVLARRGYQRKWPTAVQAAEADEVLDRTAAPGAPEVRITPVIDEEWFGTYCRSESPRISADAEESEDRLTPESADIRARILRRIAQPTAYASVRLDGEPVAIALGVREQDWLGIYCQATLPSAQRRGAARAILHALAHWGRADGARKLYLQVMDDNPAALVLYDKAGFRTVYQTHYRVLA
ncbi:GNAT family N-acetyltransferase [Crossiella sp. SN42]|uniref:GNAT family N-acetyltransferase n=1 Tax=Crossiella sp. SN42 TaxID=2944808 RepID=UPI00207CBE7E|nr:GNAT family N-acetyltransferase [Crossiella sp. SN42]MCO1575928.1 GNAT family N-acetyltransferase [Crossiella sp. SN42]